MIRPIEHWRTIDSSGVTMPWYTRPCLQWLDTIDLNFKYVFEYGCGKSTEWYKERGAITWGVDDNAEWIPKECGFKVTSDKNTYVKFIGQWSVSFDIVVIDGVFRDDCTEYALMYLKPGGFLIIDNYEQASADLPDWPKTKELTKDLPVTIYQEPGHSDWATAVFTKL